MFKGITNIKYNHLNQPTEVDFGTKKTVYTYTATGGMLKTEIYQDGKLKSTTDYNGAFVYENNTLSFINIPGGRIIAATNEYQYNLTDHLGNVRVTFKDSSGTAVIIPEDHYYPFGMRMSGQHFSNTDLVNKYLYNGKEQQEQTGYYDYGFRQLDPQLGRWHVVDAMAEKYMSTSPYAYVMNNPINAVDVMGLYMGGELSSTSYIKPYLDSNNSHHGDGMIYYNNFPGSLSRLSSLRAGDNSFQDYISSTTAAQRKHLSYNKWYRLQERAAMRAGRLSRQDALDRGYTFKAKWRRKTETLTFNYSGYDKDDPNNIEQPLSEVQVIYELYYVLDDVWFGDIETGVENKIGSVIITGKQRLSKQQLLDLTKNEKKRFEQYGDYTNYLLAAISVSVLKNPYMSGGAILTGISVNKAISQTNGNFDTFTKEINDKFPDGVSIVTKQRSYYNTINMTTSANISIFVYSNGGVLIGEISYATP